MRRFISSSSFKLIIGEEGIAAVYFKGNKVESRLFVKSPKPEDIASLKAMLETDKDAPIELYIDILDQSYLQRILPGVDGFSIKKLAQTRIDKETPEGYLRYPLQVCRVSQPAKAGGNRKDWLYIFISTAYEAPISLWVDLLTKFENPIIGLYFLPVELYSIIRAIKHHNKYDQYKGHTRHIRIVLDKIKGVFRRQDKVLWEVLMVSNKTGGVRQAVYRNGKVVFTRLLNNVMDPNPNIVAGNIEQELNSSIEYLRRFSFDKEDNLDIYMILSAEIKKNVRVSRLGYKNIHLMSPYELGQLTKLDANIVREEDRFAEPIILALLQQYSKNPVRVHNKQTKNFYIFYKSIHAVLSVSVFFIIPALLASMIFLFSQIYTMGQQISLYDQDASNLQSKIEVSESQKKNQEELFGPGSNIVEIKDVIRIYKALQQKPTDPLENMFKIASIEPSTIRVRSYVWEGNLSQIKSDNLEQTQTNAQQVLNEEQKVNITASIVLYNATGKYEDLANLYKLFEVRVRAMFNGYNLTISELPKVFQLNQIQDELLIQITATKMPKSEVNKT